MHLVATLVTEKVAIMGSTGSVGVSTLDVIRFHPEQFKVSALSANNNVELMLRQCEEFRPENVVMVEPSAAAQLEAELKTRGLSVQVAAGADQLNSLIGEGADSVVCAIVGAAGLPSTLSAIRHGCKVLIANKEPLVMLGPTLVQLATENNAVILPLDSEHNAIFQCLPNNWQKGLGRKNNHTEFGVRRLLLTGSGGPFRTRDPESFPMITPDQACAHPNWDMGRKISVDSATLMNKGLELIEACALFNLEESLIDVVIHPQSVVHSMVEYVDGSVIAQMANPDMKVPIANALGWPHRIESGVSSLDLFSINRFDFESPDEDKFPALRLAREAARTGGDAPATLNAANEIAVAAFLNKEIRFDQITAIVDEVLNETKVEQTVTLESVVVCDQRARERALQLVQARRV